MHSRALGVVCEKITASDSEIRTLRRSSLRRSRSDCAAFERCREWICNLQDRSDVGRTEDGQER